MSFNGLITGTS